jgi:hypothetical protein
VRDPERVNRILNIIDRIWTGSDLRLMQIIAGSIPGKVFAGPWTFYIEDDVIEKHLSEYLRKLEAVRSAKENESEQEAK